MDLFVNKIFQCFYVRVNFYYFFFKQKNTFSFAIQVLKHLGKENESENSVAKAEALRFKIRLSSCYLIFLNKVVTV